MSDHQEQGIEYALVRYGLKCTMWQQGRDNLTMCIKIMNFMQFM